MLHDLARQKQSKRRTSPSRPCLYADINSTDAGQKLNHLGSGPVAGGVIKNQDFISFLAGQHIDETGDNNHPKQKLPPVVLGIFEKIVGRVPLEPQAFVTNSSLEKIAPFKRQHEENREKGWRRSTPHFSDPTAMWECADSEGLHKGGNPVLQSYLLLADLGIAWYCPFKSLSSLVY